MPKFIANLKHRTIKQHANECLIKILQRTPISSEFIGPPKGVYQNTFEWINQSKKKKHKSVVDIIYTDRKCQRVAPKTLENKTPWQFFAFYGGMNCEDQDAFIVKIPNGRVIGEGSVVTSDDYLLGDISREMIIGGDQTKHSIFKNWKLPPLHKTDQNIAVVAVQKSANYWHWMFDLLPRLHLINKANFGFDRIDAIVINKLVRPFQKQYLKVLDIDFSSLIECEKKKFHLKAKNLIVPSLTQGASAKWAVDFLHEEIRPKTITERKTKKIKLYISRDDAKKRKIINETDVLSTIDRFGFVRVKLSQLSVSEQANLFASAEIVISPHGASLSNLVFCDPGTKVIELFPPRYANPCFWAISNYLNLDYYCLFGEGFSPPEPPESENPKQWFHSFSKNDEIYGKDIYVDCKKIRNLIKLAGF